MFVKFDCGCVGLVGVQGETGEKRYVIQGCDRDWEGPGLFLRDMTGKTWRELSAGEVEHLVKEVNDYLAAGSRFVEVLALLGLSLPWK